MDCMFLNVQLCTAGLQHDAIGSGQAALREVSRAV